MRHFEKYAVALPYKESDAMLNESSAKELKKPWPCVLRRVALV